MRELLRSKGANPPDPVTPNLLARWFDEALKLGDPRPSQVALEAIARQINFLVERPGGCREVFLEESARRYQNLRDTAKDLRLAYAAYAEIGSSYRWDRTIEVFSSVDRLLEGIGINTLQHVSPRSKRGRPEEHWHECGRKFAPLIIEVMRGVKFKGRLSKTTEDSVTAQVCASVIRHIFRNNVKPAGFAAAMKRRNRGRGRKLGIPEGRVLSDK
jgi:hypothetical protein